MFNSGIFAEIAVPSYVNLIVTNSSILHPTQTWKHKFLLPCGKWRDDIAWEIHMTGVQSRLITVACIHCHWAWKYINNNHYVIHWIQITSISVTVYIFPKVFSIGNYFLVYFINR